MAVNTGASSDPFGREKVKGGCVALSAPSLLIHLAAKVTALPDRNRVCVCVCVCVCVYIKAWRAGKDQRRKRQSHWWGSDHTGTSSR